MESDGLGAGDSGSGPNRAAWLGGKPLRLRGFKGYSNAANDIFTGSLFMEKYTAITGCWYTPAWWRSFGMPPGTAAGAEQEA